MQAQFPSGPLFLLCQVSRKDQMLCEANLALQLAIPMTSVHLEGLVEIPVLLHTAVYLF